MSASYQLLGLSGPQQNVYQYLGSASGPHLPKLVLDLAARSLDRQVVLVRRCARYGQTPGPSQWASWTWLSSLASSMQALASNPAGVDAAVASWFGGACPVYLQAPLPPPSTGVGVFSFGGYGYLDD